MELARGHARERLEAEFADRLSRDTIDRFVAQAFAEMADHAATDDWVPVLAERFARQQLTALAKVEGRADGLPVVLFVDEHDAGRSQLARALFEEQASGRAHSWSGGFAPRHELDPGVSQLLAEAGVELVHQFPKPVTDEIVASADLVVVLGEVPSEPLKDAVVEQWSVEPLDGMDEGTARRVRDDLAGRVRDLAHRLTT